MKRSFVTAFVILLLLPIMTPALTDKAAASRIPGAEGGVAPPAPGFEITLPAIGETDPRAGLAGFTQYFFILLLGLGGVLAFAMIAFAGLQWTLSGANPSLQGDAKDRILNAVFGLVLLLGAVVILNTINPELVILREPRIGLEPLPPATARRIIGAPVVLPRPGLLPTVPLRGKFVWAFKSWDHKERRFILEECDLTHVYHTFRECLWSKQRPADRKFNSCIIKNKCP